MYIQHHKNVHHNVLQQTTLLHGDYLRGHLEVTQFDRPPMTSY